MCGTTYRYGQQTEGNVDKGRRDVGLFNRVAALMHEQSMRCGIRNGVALDVGELLIG